MDAATFEKLQQHVGHEIERKKGYVDRGCLLLRIIPLPGGQGIASVHSEGEVLLTSLATNLASYRHTLSAAP